jgi:hypothetical protein
MIYHINQLDTFVNFPDIVNMRKFITVLQKGRTLSCSFNWIGFKWVTLTRTLAGIHSGIQQLTLTYMSQNKVHMLAIGITRRSDSLRGVIVNRIHVISLLESQGTKSSVQHFESLFNQSDFENKSGIKGSDFNKKDHL